MTIFRGRALSVRPGRAAGVRPDARGWGRIGGARSGSDRGSVTVEAAVALSALVVVLVLCLAGIALVVAQVRVTDAAAEAARLAARGDDDAARAAVAQLAPAGSEVHLSGGSSGGDLVTARVAAPPLGGLLPGVHVSAAAVAARQPPMLLASAMGQQPAQAQELEQPDQPKQADHTEQAAP